jgi:hypothetical protein
MAEPEPAGEEMAADEMAETEPEPMAEETDPIEMDEPSPEMVEEMADQDIWTGDIIESLWNLLAHVMNWLHNLVQAPEKSNLYDALDQLAADYVAINNQTKPKVMEKVFDAYSSGENWINEKTKDLAWATYAKYLGWRTGEEITPEMRPAWAKITVEGFTDEEGKEVTKGLKGVFGQVADGLEQSLKKIGVDREGSKLFEFAANLGKEITGLARLDREKWRNLFRLVKAQVDAPRKRIADITTAQIKKAFNPKKYMLKSEWKAINDVFLRLDLTSLTKLFSMNQIRDLIADSSIVQEAVKEIEQTLEREFGRNGIAYANQAHSLGINLATGMFPDEIENPMTNAHDIAHLYFLHAGEHKTVRGDLNKAAEMIDALASLRGLQYISNDLKSTALRVVDREIARNVENHGITTLMGIHDHFKAKSLKDNFGGNPTGTWKGYTVENLNKDISIKYAPNNEYWEKSMEAKGYKKEAVLPKDLNDPNKTTMAMYVSGLGLDSWRSTGTSLTNPTRKGRDLLDSYEDAMEPLAFDKMKKDLRKIRSIKAKQADAAFNRGMKMTVGGQPKLVPVISPVDGFILNYRYIMNNNTKDVLLGRDDLAHETLGRMMGDIHNKIASEEANDAMVDAMYEEYQVLRDDPLNTYVMLSPNSLDPKLKELWLMLPDNMKDRAEEKFGVRHLPIRRDLMNYQLGFREVSLAATAVSLGKRFDIKVPHALLIAIRGSENLWREVVTIARGKESILLPAVVVQNMLSNVFVLLAHGIPPNYIIKHMFTGLKAMKSYLKQRQELDELNNSIGAAQAKGQPIDKFEARRAYLQQSLEGNPANELIQEGLFSAIVEDIEPESFTGANRNLLTHKIGQLEEASKKAGFGILFNLGKELAMMRGSKTFAMAAMANQYGDFIGRYVMYKYDMEVKKVDKQTAIDNALDAFIFYDEPTDPILQGLNDYGFVWYSKFYLRIQRTIFRLVGEKPANMFMLYMLQRMSGTDLDDIGDYLFSLEKLGNRIDVFPVERPLQSLGFPMKDWLTWPFNPGMLLN